MPTCITQTFRAAPGFTLVELLVTALILSTLASLIAVNLAGYTDSNRLAFEVDRLTSLINLARHQAMAKRQTWGLVSRKNGYYFVVYGDQSTEMRKVQQPPFTERNLNGLTLTVIREGEALPDKSNNLPDIFILTNGEYTPFIFDIRNKQGQAFRVKSDGFSEIVVSDAL